MEEGEKDGMIKSHERQDLHSPHLMGKFDFEYERSRCRFSS